MILFNVTHPPAGGNPIIVIMSVSIDYLINPIIIGSLIILFFGVVLNRLILKKKYPFKWTLYNVTKLRIILKEVKDPFR